MNRWKIYNLSDIADVQTGPFGSQLHQRDYVDVGTPCIMPCNIGANLDVQTDNIAHLKASDIIRLNKYCVKEGDIIYSRRGDIEKCAYINHLQESWLCGTGCLRIRPNTSICFPKYLAYLLSTKESKKWIVANAVGTTMLNLNSSILNTMPVSLPPLAEQKRIADILSAIDDKIELNRRINANLEQQAQALYKSWFVDNKKDDWEEVELGDIATILAGGDKPEIYVEKQTDDCKVPIYSNGIDNEGLFGYTRCAKIYEHSITISARGTIGFVCLRTEPYVPIVRLISVIPQYNNLSAEYLYLWAITQNISGTGTTQQQLTIPYFKKTKIIIPNQELLIKFNKVISPIFITLKKNKTENNNLSNLRDTLLPKLMSGEIKI